ncbi:hypothetical protein CPB85DRAFT_1217413, partial [Mucidula mucida]
GSTPEYEDGMVPVTTVPTVLGYTTTQVYQKVMNAYLYIPWASSHSEASKRAWIRGELIRYVRICSKEEDFAKIRTTFLQRLRARGYPGRWLTNVFDDVTYSAERPKALVDNSPPVVSDDPPIHVLKLTHNPLWDTVDFGPEWRQLERTWADSGTSIPDIQFLASFKKPTALGDKLNRHNLDAMRAYHNALAVNV